MICSRRSARARSARSMALSRSGSSGRACIALVTNRSESCFDGSRDDSYGWDRSAGLQRHRGRSWRMHAAPIQTFKQSGELGGRQVNDAVLHLGPAELTILQSLGDENHSSAIPEHQLDAIRALGAEDINSPGERIGLHGLAHERGQSVGTFAEV